MLRTESLTRSGAEPFLTFLVGYCCISGHNLKALCAVAREHGLNDIYTLTSGDA